jgi:glycosyltransferase involved in cell wall biosynthesis
VEEKGIATLLRAWTEHDPGLPLVIAGDGPLAEDVRAAADGSDGWITWLGRVTLQAQAQVTVVPSEWYEAGPPLVLLQALAAATPVVCTDLANIAATAEEAGAADVFPLGDSAALAAAVRRLGEDRDLLTRRARAGRLLYERDHTPASALSTLERVYGEVVA